MTAPSPGQFSSPIRGMAPQSPAPSPIQGMTPAAPARTAYDIRYETTMSPFVRAKYGLGAGPPTALSQLAEPRMASGAAAQIPASVSKFTPSSQAVQAPRLNGAQFGQDIKR